MAEFGIMGSVWRGAISPAVKADVLKGKWRFIKQAFSGNIFVLFIPLLTYFTPESELKTLPVPQLNLFH